MNNIQQFRIRVGTSYATDATLVLVMHDACCAKEYSIESKAWYILASMFKVSKPNLPFTCGTPEFRVCRTVWNHFDDDQMGTEER